MRTRFRDLAAGLALLALNGKALRAQVPVVSLGGPVGELSEPFSQVSGVRELGDGRVVVTDMTEFVIKLADFDRDRLTEVGRHGGGPGEYQIPFGLVPLPGDTSMVFDIGNGRFLLLDPDGTPGTTPTMRGLGQFQIPRFADGAGRLYFTAGSSFGAGGSDSIPIWRYDRATGLIDTVARLKVPVMKAAAAGSGGVQMQLGGATVGMPKQVPFQPRDAWAVSPDGLVAVVRVADYHVEWWGAGEPVIGPPVDYQPVPVTEADKRSARDNAPRATIATSGGGTQTVHMPQADESEWPSRKPPFAGRAALVAPDGRLWVSRNRRAGEAPLYDVFDGSGVLVRQVAFPPDTKLVGFGRDHLYVTWTDDDGLVRLRRYRG